MPSAEHQLAPLPPDRLDAALDGPLLSALEQLEVPVWITDQRGVVRWRNDEAAALLRSGGAERLESVTAPITTGEDVVGLLSIAPHARRSAFRHPAPRLTRRQREVLELLAHGRTTRQIAADLGIAEDTARNHIRLLLAELRVHTRLEAVVAAYRNHWL
jgi:DNA-binding CsgD family transcriptional regulator